MRTGPLALLAAAAIACACAPALREPPPVADLGGPSVPSAGAGADAVSLQDLLDRAEASFAQRPDRARVATARDLFLAAARSDESDVRGLIGATRACAWLIEHEHDGGRRAALATEAVQASQWCQRRAPARVECTYRLALALGQQARERPGTAADALPRIVSLLEQVIAADPLLDGAGGHRVLALTMLRAPGWPAGPGDPEAGLEHAREADALVPGVDVDTNGLDEPADERRPQHGLLRAHRLRQADRPRIRVVRLQAPGVGLGEPCPDDHVLDEAPQALRL